jgi:hypothetical protein
MIFPWLALISGQVVYVLPQHKGKINDASSNHVIFWFNILFLSSIVLFQFHYHHQLLSATSLCSSSYPHTMSSNHICPPATTTHTTSLASHVTITPPLSLRDVGKLRVRMKEKRKWGQRRGPAALGGVKPTHHLVQAFSSPSTMRQCDTYTLSSFTVVGPFLLLPLMMEQHDTHL